uniref:ATP-binding cassette transporter YOR1 n=1 Tax=Kwoniella bestiolae CBS 10118 TaxID=1296100 RepID=A0A1B9FYG8_9TREE|nr:ATP-binding cassette transporter YOR1 [Kwoniella bestiolae CBS 10118]OCF23805.1 ATP-binding cassette transporter YOR1 [Kwoniella bestiolae CBS 10118]
MPSSTGRDSSPSAPSDEAPVPSSHSVSTRVGGEDEQDLKKKISQGSDDKNGSSSKEYEERGIQEIEDEGAKRKVMVVMEQKTGKEILKHVDGGPYTQPRWRHSLPFIRPKHPPPPPPLTLEDAKVTPEVTANFWDTLFFNWISPMMALGSARPLQDTDLWKMDEARSAHGLAEKLLISYAARTKAANEYNARLADPNTPLPFSKRMKFSLLPNRQKREKGYREKHGKKHASLALALNDVFGWFFISAGFIKLFGDVCQAVTPLLIRALIKWSTNWQIADALGTPKPKIGNGVGMAIGLLLLLLTSSLSIHHYFVRSMGVGVLSRAALISGIYQQALRFTQKSRGEIPNGKLVNHISTDTSRIDFAAGFAHIIWTAPIQMIVIIIILLVQIGYSALPGIAFLLIMTPLQVIFMKNLFAIRKKAAQWTDKRAKLLQEILGGMRIVKYMAWEIPFLEKVHAIRGMELKYIRSLLTFRSGMMAFAMALPTLAAIISFITYSATAHDLQAATIFTVITLFQLMRMPLMMWPMTLSAVADALNALGRLEVVFDAELATETLRIDRTQEEAVKIEHASFTWDAAPIEDDDGMMKKLENRYGKNPGAGKGGPQAKEKKTKPLDEKKEKEHVPEAKIFQIHDIDISIPKGSLTAIVGAIGSGKSSFLQGLMGEMRRTEGKVTFSGSTSLCAQTPWIQNATVRENILFGQPWNEERYWAAVRDACLEPDLELLEDGDGTEIGEKGINLSGGQKQRVNIARAIYFNADIIALDDPLSALDAGVGKALFFNAIVGALNAKTRILVTHALHFLPYVDNIIMMEDGRIGEMGTYNELKARDGAFARLIREFGNEEQHEEAIEQEEDAMNTSGPAHKYDRSKMVAKGTAHTLMQAEERNTGALKKGTFWSYIKAGNGLFMAPILLVAIAFAQATYVITSYWLVWWQEYKWDYGNGFYMGIYAGLGILTAITMFFQGFSNALINYFASVKIHKNAITRVMFAPQSFFDTTPLGRIMNRFSKDTDTIDNTLSDAMRMAVGTLSNIVGATILLAIVEPYFLIAMGVVSLLYVHNAAFYRRSSREFKRIDSILRSSLYSHFSESLSGVATIRSYGESDRFFKDNVYRMDVENRAYYLTIINQRWLGLRLDFLGSLLSFSVAIIVVCSHKVSAASGGLGLSTIISVQQSFSWLVRQIAEVENDMVGAERIMHYANELDQEAPHQINEVKPKSSWPEEGRIEFNNVKMRYREELPDVLKGLTMNVGASEKIGVVGRTGAGKSSIMVALFRMSELSGGSIKIDGVDVSKIGLNDLRSGISIIPQDPLLFSGTLRSNIDPFNTKTDAELYDTLRRAHLISNSPRQSTSLDGETEKQAQNVNSPSNKRFTLDTVIEEEGGNLSVGERSLVSLARALVRNTKVLVLDEATASVDVETDAKIQETIRNEFRDKTLLCIAHRLKTILSYDRILVMADGQVEEFDTPENLFLKNGIFTEMCGKASLTLGDIRAAAALRF